MALVTETHESLKGRLEAGKGALKSKGLRIDVKEMKLIISSEDVRKVTIEGKFTFVVCRKDVDSNSILRQIFLCWVQKRCNGIGDTLKEVRKFKCETCANQQT